MLAARKKIFKQPLNKVIHGRFYYIIAMTTFNYKKMNYQANSTYLYANKNIGLT